MQSLRRCTGICVLALLSAASAAFAQDATKSLTAANTLFAPLQQWESALVKGDTSALQALYSADPAAELEAPAGRISVAADIAFWSALKPRRLKLEVSQSDGSKAGLQEVVFQAEIRSSKPGEKHPMYVTEGQIWQQQSAGWRLIVAKRTDAARLPQPASLDHKIYPAESAARTDIRQALDHAARNNKRVLVIFGANWCYDCHVLDLAFHRPDIAAAIMRGYEIVHVNIGDRDKNQDLMQQYGVPMTRGIPAIAVLEANGKVLFSQANGEFANARALGPDDLLGFLNHWKPQER